MSSANLRNRRGPATTDDRVSDPHLYLDLDFLKEHISETGRIVPNRISGASAKMQRRIAQAVKRARFLALIPYCDNHRK
jgi:small subunit ribosomal protein S18